MTLTLHRVAVTLILIAILTTDHSILAQNNTTPPFTKQTDILYATAENHPLLLDLYTPNNTPNPTNPPLIVWVHGGAWREGTKDEMPLLPLVNRGFAIASIDYRLSPVAPFPAQIHDIKAAIRYLRANAAAYNINTERIAIAGSSAGGHLAALVGVTNNHPHLEGTIGNHTDQPSSVHAIIDYYGPTDFTTILDQSTVHGLGVRVPALQLLLGDQPENTPRLAKLASPVSHVDPNDPPLLIFHGDQDIQVPINQSHQLHGLYKKHNLTAQLEVVHNGGHGGDLFYQSNQLDQIDAFLQQHLKTSSP